MDLDIRNICFTKFSTRGFWPQHSLGRPILGTPETVEASTAIRCYALSDWFAPDHLVVTAQAMSRTSRCWISCSASSAA